MKDVVSDFQSAGLCNNREGIYSLAMDVVSDFQSAGLCNNREGIYSLAMFNIAIYPRSLRSYMAIK